MAKYDVFSKRDKPLPDTFQYDKIPVKLRNQIVLWWRDGELERIYVGRRGASLDEHINGYRKIADIICREHGKLHLNEAQGHEDNDLVRFFLDSDEVGILLDIVEWSARFLSRGIEYDPDGEKGKQRIQELNHRFRENGVGYEFDWHANRLLRIGDLVLHQEAVRPALSLLAQPTYKTANEEYLKAHKHFRNQEYDDCLTECCNAFESSIKII